MFWWNKPFADYRTLGVYDKSLRGYLRQKRTFWSCRVDRSRPCCLYWLSCSFWIASQVLLLQPLSSPFLSKTAGSGQLCRYDVLRSPDQDCVNILYTIDWEARPTFTVAGTLSVPVVISSNISLKSCVHLRMGNSVISIVWSSTLLIIPLTLYLSASTRSIEPYNLISWTHKWNNAYLESSKPRIQSLRLFPPHHPSQVLDNIHRWVIWYSGTPSCSNTICTIDKHQGNSREIVFWFDTLSIFRHII